MGLVRSKRAKILAIFIAYLTVFFLLTIIAARLDAMAPGHESAVGPVGGLYFIGALIWFAMMMPKIGKSRWWVLGVFIPLYSFVLLWRIAEWRASPQMQAK